MGDQRLAIALLLNARRGLEQRVERTVRRDQLARTLLADARHPFDVVDAVAHQREHVHDLVGPHAELFADAGLVEPEPFVARVVDFEAVADELEEVLVARDDRDLEPALARLARQRPDHVVGFVPREGQHRDAERLAGLAHPRHLLGQVGRHRRTVRLVVGGQLGAERRTGQIERRGDEFRVVVRDELAQHRREPVHGVRRSAVGTGQPVYRVIRAIHLRAAVDEEHARQGHRAIG